MTAATSGGHQSFLVTGLLAICLLLCGCRTAHDYLIPPPIVYALGEIDPYRRLEPEAKTSTVDVLYATDRNASGPANDRRYGTGTNNALRLGVASVRFGDGRLSWEQLYAATMSAQPPGRIPLVVTQSREWSAVEVDVENSASVPRPQADAFAEQLNQRFREANSYEILIYVGGYNNDFYLPVCRTAQLYHYLGRRQACLAYSWPSQASMWSYISDVRRARESVPNLVWLLEFLAQRTEVEQINIVSYSTGCTLTSEALLQLYERHAHKPTDQLRLDTRIGRVLFLAGDIDLRTFSDEQLRRYYRMPRSLGITVSRHDTPLKMIGFLFGVSPLGTLRVDGMTQEEMRELAAAQWLEVIDLSYRPRRSAGQFRGHFYWYSSGWVLADILASVRFHLPAEQRGLVRRADRPFWYFPGDYPQRINQILRTHVAADTLEATNPLAR